MTEWIRYDDTHLGHLQTGKGMTSRLRAAHTKLERLRKTGEQGFFELPYDLKIAGTLMRKAAALRKKFDRLLVIGIGGSDLGARTIWQSVGQPKKGMWLTFLSNPDPELIAGYGKPAEWWKRTAINIVSKSGSTLETLAIFLSVREGLIRSVGRERHHQHIFVTTEAADNPLRRLAHDEHYEMIDHPMDVGGRFSVLSSVGLFPAACAGVNIKKMLLGAQSVEDARRKQGTRHVTAQYAAALYHAMSKNGQNIHVIMPYAEYLSQFSFWYRQLWAESLGKDGKGPTPVAALGAIDQHSQIQLYNDGPNDKVVTFIVPERARWSARVPRDRKKLKGLEYINGLDFEAIMHAEYRGTAQALHEHGRPHATLFLPKICPESLGALFHFYLCATAYFGELLGINTYNQPGVEAGKVATRKILTATRK